MNSKKSFTLIELLVVISVIGLLSSIVLVSTKGIREKAKIAKTLEFSQSVQTALGSEAVGIWTFDDCTSQGAVPPGGVVKDSSGYGNNGTVSGALCDQETPQKIIGQGSGKWALSFDGVNDSVSVAANNALDLNTSDFTMEGWFYYTGVIPEWVGMCLGQRYGEGVCLTQTRILSDDTVSGGGIISIGYTTSAQTGRWNHLVITHDVSTKTFKAYLNGLPNGSGTHTASALDESDHTVNVGRNEPSTYFFNGLIDEVRIYEKALTLGKIQRHYVQGLEKHQLVKR